MIRHFLSRQFVAFLITGGIAAAVNFGTRILYNAWINYSLSIVISYLTGMVTAFILARVFVFQESSEALHRSALYFMLVNIAAVAQTWIVSMLLAYYALPALGIQRYVKEIAHGIGIAIPVFTSYIGHKRWTFKQREQ